MRFQKFGHSFHLRIRNAADLEQIPELEEAHWVATGCPTRSIHADPVFESYLDTDQNERIMCFEVRDAILWMLRQLSDRSGIDRADTILVLDALDTSHDEGKDIHASAIKILRQLRAEDRSRITLEQVRKIKDKIEGTPISEAGVVLPKAAGTEALKQFILDAVKATGGTEHPAGESGLNKDNLETFLKAGEDWLAWLQKRGPADGQQASDLMPLGQHTDSAFKIYAAVKDKIDQFFAQCDAVALSKRAAEHILPGDEQLKATDLADPEAIIALLKRAPLATPRPDHVLNLGDPINPQYEAQLDAFRTEVMLPILKRSGQILSESEWQTIKQAFKPHETWVAEKAGAAVEPLGEAKVRAYLASDHPRALETLIEDSKKTAVEMDNIRKLEKLILYQAHMLMLVNNFVSFPFLYDPDKRAVFETGTLIIDGRHLNFSVLVENRAEHAKMAQTSNIFMCYAQVSPGHGRECFEVAVPVTYGGKGNLCVGKRGLFREINGSESDAKVVQIIENPISIGETLVAPFHRLAKLLTGKIEAMTTAAEKKLDTAATGLTAPQSAPAENPNQKGMMAGGLLMGGSVAVAALTSAVAFITKTLEDVHPLKIVAGVVIAILAVIAPASIIALMKLRRRDLSAVLEGAGWAINARMRLTFRLSRLFTKQPRRPGKDLFLIS